MSSKFEVVDGAQDAVTAWNNVNVEGIGAGRAWATETKLIHVIVEGAPASVIAALPQYVNVTGDPRKGHSDWRMIFPNGEEWSVDYTKRKKRLLATRAIVKAAARTATATRTVKAAAVKAPRDVAAITSAVMSAMAPAIAEAVKAAMNE